jgi:hypothetical protein
MLLDALELIQMRAVLTAFDVPRDHGGVDALSPISRAPMRVGGAHGATMRLPRRAALTKRRVIDLMRVGRSSCRPRL